MKKANLFKREIAENEAWFNGSTTVLEHFFKVQWPNFKVTTMFDKKPNFWNSVSGDIPRVHSGVPALISKTWVRLINPRDIEIVVDKDQDRLDEILKDNKFKTTFLPKLIATMSWGGYAVGKISYDEGMPILEVVTPKFAKAKVKRDRIEGFEFEIYEKDLIIVEHYDKSGVWYEAFNEVAGERRPEPVPSEYEDVELAGGLIPAQLFNNTPYNSRFPELIYGESDYSNIHSQLHQLDSVLAHTQLDIEASKSKQFINDDLILVDDEGNEHFDKNETVIRLASSLMQDPNFDLKKMITLLQPDVRVEQFNATAKEITGRILANVGLSAVSVGLPGFDAVDAAADSQRARKETSIVSRNEKVATLTEDLSEFIPLILNIDNVMSGREVQEYDVSIEFDKYGAPTWEDLVSTVVEAVQGNVMSVREAVDILYDGREDDEKERLIKDIKSEGLITFTEGDLTDDGGAVE